MRIGIYPGSFNPWHAGHQDILNKALHVFDRVYVVRVQNPDKEEIEAIDDLEEVLGNIHLVEVGWWNNSLKDYVDFLTVKEGKEAKLSIIRGLRNGNDLQYEMNQQYWNEDVGVRVPFVYFITDRSLSHVSSSAIRMVNKLGLEHDY